MEQLSSSLFVPYYFQRYAQKCLESNFFPFPCMAIFIADTTSKGIGYVVIKSDLKSRWIKAILKRVGKIGLAYKNNRKMSREILDYGHLYDIFYF